MMGDLLSIVEESIFAYLYELCKGTSTATQALLDTLGTIDSKTHTNTHKIGNRLMIMMKWTIDTETGSHEDKHNRHVTMVGLDHNHSVLGNG